MLKKLQKLLLTFLLLSLGTSFIFISKTTGMNGISPENLQGLFNLLGTNSGEQKKVPEVTPEQKELLKQYNAKDLLNKYGQYTDPNLDFSKNLEELKKNFPKEKIDELINADIINLEKLFAWQNNLITSIDIQGSSNESKLSIGIYYKDVIKLLIWISELLEDYWLKNNLNNQFSELIIEQLDQDLDSIINSLNEMQACSLKIKTTKEKAEKLTTKEKLKELHNKLDKTVKEKFLISYKQIFKNLIHNKTIFYLIFQGLAKLSKERWLSPSKTFFSLNRMDTTIKQFSNSPGGSIFETLDKIMTQKPIPLFNLISLIPFLHSRPLFAGISLTEEVINFLLQDLKYYETKDGNPKKHFLFDVLDSDYMFLAKTSLIFFNSIKNLNQHIIQVKWSNYLKNNAETFSKTLKEYKNLKNAHFKNSMDTQTKADFEKIKNALKIQIEKGLNINFIGWLREKNSIFTMSDLKTRLILNIPLYILAIKSLFNHYQKGNLSFMNWESIKNVYSHPEEPFNAIIITLSAIIPFYFVIGLFITAGPGY